MIQESTRRVLGHSLVPLLVHSHRTLACSGVLASLALSAALNCLLPLSLHSLAHGKEVFHDEMNTSISYSFNPLCAWSTWPAGQRLLNGALRHPDVHLSEFVSSGSGKVLHRREAAATEFDASRNRPQHRLQALQRISQAKRHTGTPPRCHLSDRLAQRLRREDGEGGGRESERERERE